jgi:hypothetical protein
MENKKILRFLSKEKIYFPDTPKEKSNNRLSRSHTENQDGHERVEQMISNCNDMMFLQILENRRKTIGLVIEGICKEKIDKIDIQFFKPNYKREEMKEVRNYHIKNIKIRNRWFLKCTLVTPK